MSISVQSEDFDTGAEYTRLQSGNTETGGIALFSGQVRDNPQQPLAYMRLEHYPGMTEASLQQTAEQAANRWPTLKIRIIHRIGDLKPGEQIVLVGVSSAHRDAAFAACEYIMDILKTSAPFWKKEQYLNGDASWVAAKQSDDKRADRWQP
ncbi:MAG: molybdenum cofactor biosynthesis protein MoaE [Pseudomonadales bacterium]|nr:molybdenum cofactor biosynthesis protein MoaE [Pseudomonadales bacterium]